MLIIALVGGTEERREAMAAALVEAGRLRLGVYALRGPQEGARRVAVLDEVLVRFGRGIARDSGLVLSHVLTLEESQWVRKQGGHVLHVIGLPSDCIPIVRGDLLVTPTPGGERHYLDPLETISEITRRRALAG